MAAYGVIIEEPSAPLARQPALFGWELNGFNVPEAFPLTPTLEEKRNSLRICTTAKDYKSGSYTLTWHVQDPTSIYPALFGKAFMPNTRQELNTLLQECIVKSNDQTLTELVRTKNQELMAIIPKLLELNICVD